jgi:hypothetical protein
MKYLKLGMSALIGASACMSSYASTYDLSSPLSSAAQTVGSGVAMGGSFSDRFNFTMDQSGVAKFSAHAAFGQTGRNGLQISVFDSSQNLLKFGANELVFGTLNAGSYYATVSGFFKSRGSEYCVSALAAPVPLPAAIWSLGMGIAGFWFVGRRKQNATAAA